MALQTPFAVEFEQVFRAGAYVVAVEAAQDFDKLREGAADPQVRDKDTGERVWTVRVVDADPDARSSEVKVKLLAPVQPVPPEPVGGTPFRPVEFTGLTVTPYVKENAVGRPKVAYSFKATGMRAPKTGSATAASNGSSSASGSAKSSAA